MKSERELYRVLDTNGDGTGTKSAIGDYSSGGLGETIFYIQPPSSEIFHIARMIVSYSDAAGMSAVEYGNTAAALTNGITLRKSDDNGVITDLTAGLPIKSNAEWGRHCYDVDLKTWSTGNEFIVVRWTFTKDTGESDGRISLDGIKNERLEIVLNDDFTGLVDQYFLVRGGY